MKIALYPGAFKPPHRGHFFVAKQLVDMPDVNKVMIVISPKEREGINAEQSLNVWNLYKTVLGNKFKLEPIIADSSPVSYVYSQVKNNPEIEYVAAFGKGEESRFDRMGDFNNVTIYDSGNEDSVSATDLRAAIASGDIEGIKSRLPKGIDYDKFMDALQNTSIKETKLYENKFPLLKEFVKHCKGYLKLKSLPPVTFSYDGMAAEGMKSFGGYNPNTKSIQINVANRHQADVFRTLAHEFCHYKQDVQNRLEPNSGMTGHPHENEANSHAAIMMRDFAQSNPEMFRI